MAWIRRNRQNNYNKFSLKGMFCLRHNTVKLVHWLYVQTIYSTTCMSCLPISNSHSRDKEKGHGK